MTGITQQDIDNPDACIINGMRREHIFHWADSGGMPSNRIVECSTCGQTRDRSRQKDTVLRRGVVQPVASDLGALGTSVAP